MKRFLKTYAAAAVMLSMIGAPLAIAGQDQHGGPPPQHFQNHPQGMQHMAMQHEPARPIAHQQRPLGQAENHAPPMQHEVYAGSGHRWHSGDHFNGDRHYVSNWNQYHLRQPPAGYEWVQDGSQFVLVAIASGIIADVILNATYQ